MGLAFVLACNVGGGAVDRLVEAGGGIADGGGWQQADGAGDHARLIGENVAEHVLSNHHVELAGVFHELHGAVAVSYTHLRAHET